MQQDNGEISSRDKFMLVGKYRVSIALSLILCVYVGRHHIHLRGILALNYGWDEKRVIMV